METLSYKRAGVDIDAANAAKVEMKRLLGSPSARVLNRVGAFASLIDIDFPELEHPVLVMKIEEPGSKQKLALQHGRIDGLCRDLVSHLVNDTIAMGARPLAVLDVIVCGRLDHDVVTGLVAGIAQACKEQGCELVGGETSEQPKVLGADRCVLAASLVGVVERAKIIDGSTIRGEDVVLALPSNGPHTNGYSLIHELIERYPSVLKQPVGDESFLDAVLRSHTPYYEQVRAVVEDPGLHGLVHITGGGMVENLDRVLPDGLGARIDLAAVRVPEVFAAIRQTGRVSEDDMIRTFNLGVGMVAICAPDSCERIQGSIAEGRGSSYVIGEVVPGPDGVQTTGTLQWPAWPAATGID